MRYRKLKGYKYELMEDVIVPTKINGRVTTPYITIIMNVMTIKAGYAWDGASGPAIDTKTFMLGSLVHDAYYQLLREGKLGYVKKRRKYADQELRRICLKEGMSKFRAWYVYRAVRMFCEKSSLPRKNPRGQIVEI